MSISTFLRELVSSLSEDNYERTISDYRFWMKIGVAHGQIPRDQFSDDILAIMQPNLVYPASKQLIHPTGRLLSRFITDVGLDPALSIDVSRTYDRIRHTSLQNFFSDNLYFMMKKKSSSADLGKLYTNVNLLAHLANFGCLNAEDVRDHILQSLTFRPTLRGYQLGSLVALLGISGATFAAYADPSVMARCYGLLKPLSQGIMLIKNEGVHDVIEGAKEVIRLWDSGWEGLPPPAIPHDKKVETTFHKSQDPAVTPVAITLGLPDVGRQSQTPTPSSLTPDHPSGKSPKSSVPPSPSISITALSDFTIADSLDDESILEPETITPHDTFYLEDGSVEVVCGKTLFRVHASALSFHSPVLRQMFSPANLAAFESPNGCPRIVSSDTPADFATLLKVVYLPEFQERSKAPDFATFSSLLRVSSKYEMPNLRVRLLKTIRDAYPENFEGLGPSKTFGESVFDAPKPHPNAVLNLFVQQKVTSALPMAYYMAARRGLDSLMDTRLPQSATLSGQTLRYAMRGLMTLREMELKETHRIIFTIKDATGRVGCSSAGCPSGSSKGLSDAGIMGEHQRTFDRITGSAVGGTKILQVLSAKDLTEDTESKFCQVCAGKLEVAHAEVRRKAWAVLPEVFGLNA